MKGARKTTEGFRGEKKDGRSTHRTSREVDRFLRGLVCPPQFSVSPDEFFPLTHLSWAQLNIVQEHQLVQHSSVLHAGLFCEAF